VFLIPLEPVEIRQEGYGMFYEEPLIYDMSEIMRFTRVFDAIQYESDWGLQKNKQSKLM
jgi:hypothetical protein